MIYFGIPTYNHQTHVRHRTIAIEATMQGHSVYIANKNSSLIPHSFNMLWHEALTMKVDDVPFRYFIMMHSDLYPLKNDWLSVLVDELTAHHASVVSVVSPIKSKVGLTSTALDCRLPGDKLIRACPLTADMLRADMTFDRHGAAKMLSVHTGETSDTYEALLVNTGLWIADLKKSWVRKVAFRILSQIQWEPDADGRSGVLTDSEDWDFSRQLYGLGFGEEVYATTKINVAHHGDMGFKLF